ncbi:25205_t:CDS:2 [Gigaspora rosea]|nr:25205_t:CDS:2 [Gigaspora rosea]
MATSTSKNGDVSLNIGEESKVEEEPKAEEKKLWKTFAVSPKGDLVVEFVVKENFEFELQMYDLGPKNDSNLDDQRLSYRDLQNIDIPTKFKFTIEQLNSIKKFRYKNI